MITSVSWIKDVKKHLLNSLFLRRLGPPSMMRVFQVPWDARTPEKGQRRSVVWLYLMCPCWIRGEQVSFSLVKQSSNREGKCGITGSLLQKLLGSPPKFFQKPRQQNSDPSAWHTICVKVLFVLLASTRACYVASSQFWHHHHHHTLGW